MKKLCLILLLCCSLAGCGRQSVDVVASDVDSDTTSWEEYHEVFDKEEEEVRAKETPSDITGMSVYDKVFAGMLPWNDSDSDRDGLTDKEELEVYGTDPLNADSVGDGLPDGYRAFGGIDKGELFLAPKEVTVGDTGVQNALMLSYEREYFGAQGQAVCAYMVEDYLGEVSVDFSEQIEKQPEGDYVAVRVNYTTGEETEVPLVDGIAKTVIEDHTIIALYNRAESALDWDAKTVRKGDVVSGYLVVNEASDRYEARIDLDLSGLEDYSVEITDMGTYLVYYISYKEGGAFRCVTLDLKHKKKYHFDRFDMEFGENMCRYCPHTEQEASMYEQLGTTPPAYSHEVSERAAYELGKCRYGTGENRGLSDGLWHTHESFSGEIHGYRYTGDCLFEFELSGLEQNQAEDFLSRINFFVEETTKEQRPNVTESGVRYYDFAVAAGGNHFDYFEVGVPQKATVLEATPISLVFQMDGVLCYVERHYTASEERYHYVEGSKSFEAYVPLEGLDKPILLRIRGDSGMSVEKGKSIEGQLSFRLCENGALCGGKRAKYSSKGKVVTYGTKELVLPSDVTDKAPEGGAERYVSNFHQAVDASPILNFPNYLNSGGLCAGFSLVTAQVYEGKKLPAQALEEIDGKTYSYDISGKELDNLLEKGGLGKVYEGDAKHFFNVPATEKEKLNDKDAAFIDFFGYYWAKANSKNGKFVSAYNFTPDFGVIDRVIEFYKSNPDRLLLCGLSKYGASHSINIYGVERDEQNPDVWYLLVYDSNYPIQRIQSDTYKGQVDMRIRVTKKVKRELFGSGVKEYFTYYYKPTSDGIEYSSDIDTDSVGGLLLQHHGLTFRDSSCNGL